MAQRNVGRVDRYAQMNKQAELIAKKRAELVEKQRTAQLAKAVAAAQSLAAKLKGAAASAENEASVAEDATEKVNEKTAAEQTTANVVDSAKVQEEKSESKSKKELPTESSKSHNSLTGKTGKISFGIKRSHQAQAPVADQPPAKVQNSFCNDGSFLENFKKILEKHEQPKPPIVLVAEQAGAATTTATTATIEGAGTTVDAQSNTQNSVAALPITTLATSTVPQLTSTAAHVSMATAGSIPIGPPPPQFAFNSAMLQPNLLLPSQPDMVQSNTTLASYTPQPGGMPTAAFFTTAPPQLVPPPPPPTTVAAAMIMPLHAVPNVAPPPPPPPPQIPLALANLAPLYMIPAPEPLQLNAIPAPKEFDLNAIPKPQINLDAIQIPITEQQQQHTHLQQSQLLSQQQQQQQMHEQQLTVFSDNNDHNCIQLPTTIENLIDMVADNGDEYEDKLRTHRNQLHPAMWFLFDKNCEQYHKYRQQLNDRRQQHQYQHHQHHHQQQKQQQQQQQNQQQEQEQSPNHEQQQQQQQQLKKSEQIQNDSSSQQLMGTDNDLSQLDKVPENMSTGANAMSVEVDTNDSPIVADADKYDPESVIDSGDVDSDDEYMRNRMDRNRDNIKRRIECRNELSEEERQERAELEQDQQRRQERKKLRKSRWGDKAEHGQSVSGQSTFGNQHKPLLTAITRSDPALLQYARQNYGTTNLSEEDWKKCEEHYKINLLYQDMLRKRQELDRLARSGKFKYEYDSDEDVEGGTWEHKLRSAEMEATQAWATALTKQSEGKHHIGDFLPPEELKKFMEQYEAKKNNRQPDLSDYKEYKLKEDNIGFQMLQKLGWKEGQGLGSAGAGIVDPVNKGPQRDGNQGLGVTSAATPENCDNEYDAYRKRMMLAYRFRPNPLNNPRRAYY